MPNHYRILLLALALGTQTGVEAQSTLRPPYATAPAPDATTFTRGGLACREGRMQAATAQRVTSRSLSHVRLMNRYDVQFCHLDLAVERTATTLGAGTNVLTWARVVSATQPLDTLGFEFHPSLILDSVQVNGVRVPTARIQRLTSGDVRVRPVTAIPAGSRFRYQVWYHGTPAATGSAAIGNGISSEPSQTWGNQVTWTLSEPFSAYEWWPCKQVLTDKLDSVAVWVTTSAANKVGSQGVLEQVTPRPGNKVRYEWKSRYPIVYYLVSISVAQYVDYTIYAHPVGMPANDSLPIVNYVYNNPQTLLTFQADIDDTPALVENFSQRVITYPFWREKYGHAMAPIGGGMEHQTMTTQGYFDFTLTAHELFHQWFGDHVTCRSWRDIWINEGFASYGEYISLQDLRSQAEADQWMQDAHQWARQPVGSVVVPDADSFNVGRIFSYQLTYKKGAAVIHMLRHVIDNDSAFFAALASFQLQHAHSTATTDDLRRSLEASLGMPLGWFFDQWLTGEGYPTSDVGWNQVGSTMVVENRQTASSGTTPFFRMPIEYRIFFSGGQSQTVRLEQTQANQRWNLPVTGTVMRVEVDPAGWNLMHVLRVRRNTALQPTGIPAEAALTGLSVWPNPCGDWLTLPVALTGRTADVLDLTGRVVQRQILTVGEDRLATAELARGTYLLRVTTPDGVVRQARFVRR